MCPAKVLKHEINSYRRERYIWLKTELYKVLLFCFSAGCYLFPDPNKYILSDKNARVILAHLAIYNRYERDWRCRAIINGVVRIVVILMEHSPNWRDRVYFWGELLRVGAWDRRSLNHPRFFWIEPKPYGGEYVINQTPQAD